MPKENKKPFRLSATAIESIIFLLILVGLLPAIHDFSLFFFDLGFNLNHEEENFFSYLLQDTGLAFLLGLFALPFALYFILKEKKYAHLIGLLPFAAYLLSYAEIYVLKSENPVFWESLLEGASLIAFLYYLLRSSLLSWVFPFFLLLIYFSMSGLHMILFAGYCLAFRLFYLLISQNWEILKDLGPGKFFSSFIRALVLWSPMIVVVVFSYWSSKKIEQIAVNSLYDYTFLAHYADTVALLPDTIPSLEKERAEMASRLKWDRLMMRDLYDLRMLRPPKRKLEEWADKSEAFSVAEIQEILKVEHKQNTILALQDSLDERFVRRLFPARNIEELNKAVPFANCFKADSLERKSFFSVEKERFAEDLRISLCIETEKKKIQTHRKIDSLIGEMQNAQKAIPKAMGNMVRSSFEGLAPTADQIDMECGFFSLGCKIGEGASKAAVNASGEAFDAAGKRLASKVETEMGKLAAEGVELTTKNANLVQGRVDEELDVAKEDAYDALLHTYGLIRFILFIMDLIFFFIVIKSFAYVFARVIYSKEEGKFISLMSGEESMKKGQIRATGNTYSIAAQSAEDFYVSRIYEPSGRAPKISIPQPGKSFMARLFRRAWTMNHIDMEKGKGGVKFNAPGGREFVEWQLASDEVVVFHYRSFVAMSESIKLSTIFSLRLTSLLFGQIIFSTAQGPGTLVLSTKGKPLIGKQKAAGYSIPESRLMAWQKNSRFHVESELNVFDVFFSGVYLKRLGQDLLIVDSDQTGKAKSGIFKFFKHFMMPF